MASISRKDLLRRLRKDFTVQRMKLFKFDVEVLLEEQDNGQFAPLGILLTEEMTRNINYPDDSDVVFDNPNDNNPLMAYCLQHKSFRCVRVTMHSIYIYVIIHAYMNNNDEVVMTGVCIITDELLRKIICSQN
jgi:hypothetical protein